MRNIIKIIAAVTALIIVGIMPAALAYADKADTDTVSVIFTHDMHSHLDEFPKLKTVMDDVKKEYPESFIVDAGDFSMGTPYQTVFSQEAAELKMMDYLGYEAVTFGNHEYDYRARGLADMLISAKGAAPLLLASNIDWEATLADKTLRQEAKALKNAFDAYGVRDYAVIEHEGVKAAFFGLMGYNAIDYSPECGLIFKDYKEAAADTVEKIKRETDADIIICLSHCGTIENSGDVLKETEDYVLAEEVSDIDIIISGHSHTELDEAMKVGDTYIVSCGSYNANVGHAVLEKDGDGYALKSYELIKLNADVDEDTATQKELEKYRKLLDKRYFSLYGYGVDQVLAENDIEFTQADKLGIEQGEEPLGNLITDSYMYALGEAGEAADVAIVPLGVIRGSFEKGPITVADAFNVSSLGYGKDGMSGYPLVKAYLTGKELKAVAEVDASISNFMGVARLYSTGLEYSWNDNRLILNRAVDVKINDGTSVEKADDDKLYSVVADLYSCQMLGSVKDKSFGLLKIEPKDENGNIITDFEDHIIYDENRELKAWYALASYIDSFEDNKIPEYYGKPQGRKTEIDSWSPVEILKQPNNIFRIAAAAAVVLVLIVVGVVLLIKRLRTKRIEKRK